MPTLASPFLMRGPRAPREHESPTQGQSIWDEDPWSSRDSSSVAPPPYLTCDVIKLRSRIKSTTTQTFLLLSSWNILQP